MTRMFNWELDTGHQDVTFTVHSRTWRRWNDLLRVTEQQLVLAELELTLNNSWLLILYSLDRAEQVPCSSLCWAGATPCTQAHSFAVCKYPLRALVVLAPSVLTWMELATWRRQDEVLCLSFKSEQIKFRLKFLKVHLPCCPTRAWLCLCLCPSPWLALVNDTHSHGPWASRQV